MNESRENFQGIIETFPVKDLKRLMIIVWKWRHYYCDTPISKGVADFWKVGDTGEEGILRIDPHFSIDKDYNLEDVTEEQINDSLDIIQYYLNYLKGLSIDCKVQIYLHRNHGYKNEHRKVLLPHALPFYEGDVEHLEKINKPRNATEREGNVFIFQHEDSDLYLNSKTPYGLLGQYGNWAERYINGIHQKVAEVDKQIIKSTYFDFVWRSWAYKNKKRTYELCMDLIRTLAPLKFIAQPDFSRYESAFKELEKSIIEYERRFVHLEIVHPNLAENLNEMLQKIKNKKPDVSRLWEIRGQLLDTLNNLPGNHIYV